MRYFANPKTVGSIFPSSRQLSRQIADQVSKFDPTYRLVEFGPGTGTITALLPENTVCIELDKVFVEFLAAKFPQRKILHCDIVEYLSYLQEPINVVSSIPLIGNPESTKIRAAVNAAYNEGLIQSLITYSYGTKSPFSGCNFKEEIRLKLVLFNIPPASIWVYS